MHRVHRPDEPDVDPRRRLGKGRRLRSIVIVGNTVNHIADLVIRIDTLHNEGFGSQDGSVTETLEVKFPQ